MPPFSPHHGVRWFSVAAAPYLLVTFARDGNSMSLIGHWLMQAALWQRNFLTHACRIAAALKLCNNSTLITRLQDPASVAWNLATTSFYKAGGRPWRRLCRRELVLRRLSFQARRKR